MLKCTVLPRPPLYFPSLSKELIVFQSYFIQLRWTTLVTNQWYHRVGLCLMCMNKKKSFSKHQSFLNHRSREYSALALILPYSSEQNKSSYLPTLSSNEFLRHTITHKHQNYLYTQLYCGPAGGRVASGGQAQAPGMCPWKDRLRLLPSAWACTRWIRQQPRQRPTLRVLTPYLPASNPYTLG